MSVQPGLISGTVLDESGNPVQGAVVVVKRQSDNQTFETTTDASGFFEFTGLPGGEYHAMARYDNSVEEFNSLSKPYLTVESAIPDSGVSRWDHQNSNNDTSVLADIWDDNPGTVNGATYNSTGGPNGEAVFDYNGTSDYIDTGADIFGSVSNFSLQTVFYPRDVTSLQAISGQTTFSDDIPGYVLALNGGDIVGQVGDGTGVFNVSAAANANTLYECVLTFDSGTIELFVNGTSQGITSGAASAINPTPEFAFGRRGDGFNDSYFDGQTLDGRLYNKTLSATEVSNLYNKGSISG